MSERAAQSPWILVPTARSPLLHVGSVASKATMGEIVEIKARTATKAMQQEGRPVIQTKAQGTANKTRAQARATAMDKARAEAETRCFQRDD